MIQTLIYESNQFTSKCGEYCAQIEIDIEIEAHNNQEVDYKILAITNLEDESNLELKDFNPKEQEEILEKCCNLADAWAHEAIEDYLNKDVDAYVDWCKENN